jgi:Ca-activated chloride channel family protein
MNGLHRTIHVALMLGSLLAGGPVLAADGERDVAIEINKANGLLRSGDVDAAVKAYRQVQNGAPDRADLSYNMAVAQYRKGDVVAAEKLFHQASAAEDDELAAKAHYNLGNCNYAAALKTAETDHPAATKGLEKAIENYRSALEIDSNDADSRANIELASAMIDKLREQDKKQQQQQKQQQGQKQQQSKDQNEQKQENSKQRENQEKKDSQRQQSKDQQQSQKNPQQKPDSSQEKKSQGERIGQEQQQKKNDENSKNDSSDKSESQPQQQKSQSQEKKSEQKDSKPQSQEQSQSNPSDQKEERSKPRNQSQASSKQKPKDQRPEQSETKQSEPAKDQQGTAAPKGALSAADQKAGKTSPQGKEIAGQPEIVPEGAMTTQEAEKMLQAIRDQEMIRRLKRQAAERNQHVPVDRDW